jgi:hypothetical protein
MAATSLGLADGRRSVGLADSDLTASEAGRTTVCGAISAALPFGDDVTRTHIIASEFSCSWGHDFVMLIRPSMDINTAVRDQVNRLPAAGFFAFLARLPKKNLPAMSFP